MQTRGRSTVVGRQGRVENRKVTVKRAVFLDSANMELLVMLYKLGKHMKTHFIQVILICKTYLSFETQEGVRSVTS